MTDIVSSLEVPEQYRGDKTFYVVRGSFLETRKDIHWDVVSPKHRDKVVPEQSYRFDRVNKRFGNLLRSVAFDIRYNIIVEPSTISALESSIDTRLECEASCNESYSNF
jgi:hypothetical protein